MRSHQTVAASHTHTGLHQCSSKTFEAAEIIFLSDISFQLYLEEQFLTPLSALGFQHCCFAECPPSDGLIKGLKERIAGHFSSPYLLALRK